MSSGSAAVIGVDAGGTKTAAALATPDGAVVGRAMGGPANWQSAGREGAGQVYGALLEELSGEARRRGLRIAAVGYGLAGLDRPRDEAVLREILAEVQPFEAPYTLVNDTFCILRAGTFDGVGVGAVSGTGCNVVGIGRDGRTTRIGGLGWEFGDWGGAPDLGHAAVSAAFRGEDGRGEPTVLTDALKAHLSLDRLDDIVDLYIADASAPLRAGLLAPLVFEAAGEGDRVARDLLIRAGEELALSARIVAGRLFDADEAFPVIMGGSVFQKAQVPIMRDAFAEGVRSAFPEARPVLLDAPPLMGALLLGLDRLAEVDPNVFTCHWPDAAALDRMRATLDEGDP